MAWRYHTGPAAVLLATLLKLGWSIKTPGIWITPGKEELCLDDVCPRDIRKLIEVDATRWTWTRAIPAHQAYQHLDRPPLLDPIQKLLGIQAVAAC